MKALQKLLVAVIALSPLATFAQEAAKPAEPPKPPPPPAVQVYGTLNVNLQYTGAEGATTSAQNVKPRFAVSIDSSNVGVKGMIDVAGGLKAVYQCETQASIDGDDTRAICNRNSRVGVTGDFGTIFLGNWDTPYKSGTYGTKADDPFGNTDVFGFNGIMGSPGYGVRSSAFNSSAAAAVTASFDQRAANSVAYWSPKFSGLSFKLQASADEFSNAGGTVRPYLASGVVNYDLGNLSIVGQLEWHADAFGIRTVSGANTGANASKDAALRLAAGYDFTVGDGTLNVMGMVESLGYTQENAVDGFKSYNRVAYLLGAKYRMGDHELRARYSAALAPSIKVFDGGVLPAGAEDDLGAKSFAVGYAYHLAKSTQVFAYYTQIMNEDRARFTFGVSGAAAVVAANTPAGSSPSAAGVGTRIAF
jgi:predicted porin